MQGRALEEQPPREHGLHSGGGGEVQQRVVVLNVEEVEGLPELAGLEPVRPVHLARARGKRHPDAAGSVRSGFRLCGSRISGRIGSGGGGGGGGGSGSGSGGSSFGQAMGTAGRFAADMGSNLAKGAMSGASAKASSMASAASERVSQTMGGKLASEINGSAPQARADQQTLAQAEAIQQADTLQAASDLVAERSGGSVEPQFEGDSVGQSGNAEVDDFVNRKA